MRHAGGIGRRGRARVAAMLAMALGVGGCACALVHTDGGVGAMVRSALDRTPSRAAQGVIDWSALLRENPDTAAWLSVSGTRIDLPVVNAPIGDAEYYLDHAFDGKRSPLGCPFLDPSTDANGTYALVYAHRATDGLMFSDLQKVYEQNTFDGLGECRWYTPTKGCVVLEKLCAARVGEDDPLTQTFAWSSRQGYVLWLKNVVRRSSARVDDAAALAESSERVVGLVTCSSDQSGQPFRTVTLFSGQ